MLSKHNSNKRLTYITHNIQIIIGNETDEIIEELF